MINKKYSIPENLEGCYYDFTNWHIRFMRGYGVKEGSHPEYTPVHKNWIYRKLLTRWLAITKNKNRIPVNNLGFKERSVCIGVLMWQDDFVRRNIDEFLVEHKE